MKNIFTKLLLLSTVFTLFTSNVKADEGMWLYLYLNKNYSDMKKLGLKLTQEDIYNVNKSSLKDAIVSLGGFCSAEIISPQGLLLTNHHCAFGAVQEASSDENNYLEKGFWAKSKDQEIPAPGLTASILKSMKDITSEVKEAEKEGETEEDKTKLRRAFIDSLQKEISEDGKYDVRIRPIFEGNQYILFIYDTYKDLRLVGIPPQSVGKFGGDTDNWMWPRHTGDFSMLRIYSGPDGSPAEYSELNVPLKPKHFLPISIKGVKKGDYSMVLGFPGSTERYKSSFGIKTAMEVENPITIAVREKRLDLIKEDMLADPSVKLKYASKHARVSNYYKYFKGVNSGLARMGTIEAKKKEEAEFQKWADANPDRKEKYGSILTNLESAFEAYAKIAPNRIYLNEAAFGVEANLFSYRFSRLERVLSNKEATDEEITKAVDGLRKTVDDFFKDYNKPTDEKVFGALMSMYVNGLGEENIAPEVAKIHKQYRGDWAKYGKSTYMRSMFVDKTKVESFMANPSLKKLERDPIYALTMAIIKHYRSTLSPQFIEVYNTMDENRKLLLEGLMEKNKGKKMYPDANSTPRLSYGTVQDYIPRDAVKYSYYSTADGIVQKAIPNDYEFHVDDDLLALINAGDFGQYAEDGMLRVNFLTNNDITGGNSGSPVLNAQGHLIGCAFDGNWEAMTGDLAFNQSVQRTICVDVRYILWVTDKYAGATNLIDEMTIIK